MATTLTVTVPARMLKTSRFGWKKEDKKTKKGRRKRRGGEDENEEDKTNGRKRMRIYLVKRRGEDEIGE
ncbi:hypothetical protein WN943_004998 [Citrus x changshan-huyou]